MNQLEKKAIARAEKALMAAKILLPLKPQTGIRDLLVDLRHYADKHDADFHFALGESYGVYLREKRDYR